MMSSTTICATCGGHNGKHYQLCATQPAHYIGVERRAHPEARGAIEDHQARMRAHERELLRLMRKQGWTGCKPTCSCRGTREA
jgi:hypothetical protein